MKLDKEKAMELPIDHINLSTQQQFLQLLPNFNNPNPCFQQPFVLFQSPIPKRNAAAEVLVGWPPLKSWKKEFNRPTRLRRRRCAANYVNVENNGGGGGRGSNSMYVKVKMEGVGIGRKVNLSIHNSYQSLTAYLVALFGKFGKDGEQYEMIYQGQDGEWLPASHVPWETFIQSVQRMKLQRNNNNAY